MFKKSIVAFALIFLSIAASAQDRHPAIDSNWWVNVGMFLTERDLKASANATGDVANREFDFERALGFGNSSDLFMAELGWQFSENWGLALQYFRSSRSSSRVLEEEVEWQGNTYEIGALVDVGTSIEITRIFFARQFRDSGPHSLRLGAGLHWLEASADIAGQATLPDQSNEFRQSDSSASVPIPNIGAWYRYSPNDRWLINARLDWLSAEIDNYSGDIWNGSIGVNYSLWKNIGVGASYQYFNLNGDVSEDNWNGAIELTFTGPYLYVSGFW